MSRAHSHLGIKLRTKQIAHFNGLYSHISEISFNAFRLALYYILHCSKVEIIIYTSY